MAMGDLSEMHEQRRAIRHLLRSDDASDALASYYALWHDPRRTKLIVQYGPNLRRPRALSRWPRPAPIYSVRS